MENFVIAFILIVGWPILIGMSILIIKRGYNYYKKLKETVVGKLIIPTIFGWLFGMYMLGIVSTAYMFSLPWFFTVIPAFALFMVAIIIIYRAIATWEKQATELQHFYKNLEDLVKKRTEELEIAHIRAIEHEKEIQKLKDQFVFIAAHELKTPVTAIRWGIETALEEGKKTLDRDIINYLNEVQTSNKRLITLVDDLLNVARIEAGTIKIEPKDMDLNKTIEETLKEMKSVFKSKNIKVDYANPKSITIFSDENRIKQVMINLLSNATKYNKKGGKITIRTTTLGDQIQVSVKDSGIGIKEEDMKKLFTKFGRIEDEKTKKVSGTGLGLYVSKEIIKKLGGNITAESEYQKGTTFRFTVPIKNTELLTKHTDNSTEKETKKPPQRTESD